MPLMPSYTNIFMGGAPGATLIQVICDRLVRDSTSRQLDHPHSPPIYLVVSAELKPTLGQLDPRFLGLDLFLVMHKRHMMASLVSGIVDNNSS